MRLTAAWTARTDLASIDTGLSPEEALRRVPEFLSLLSAGKISADEAALNDAAIDVLHAACRLLPELEPADAKNPLMDARNLYEFIEKAGWPEPDFDERAEVLADCAFAAWRIARRRGTPVETKTWNERFVSLLLPDSRLRSAADEVLLPLTQQPPQDAERILLNGPETMLCVAGLLQSEFYSSPATLCKRAEFCYRYVESAPDFGLYDERDYFLGEFALLAGVACRVLFRREEATGWFEKAETRFVRTVDSATNIARLAYQKLALRLEERNLQEVLELAPICHRDFLRLGLTDDALKCRFLESGALRELDRVRVAITVMEEASHQAKTLGNVQLQALALGNLAQYYRLLGDLKEALSHARAALPLLQRRDNRVSLAKLRWCVGDILREQGNLIEAADTYRVALEESDSVGTRGVSAALHLVLTEVLLDLGLNECAEREVRAALPIIEEEKMAPEGFAALALLQESLRRRKIDRQALRNLHGFFQEEKS